MPDPIPQHPTTQHPTTQLSSHQPERRGLGATPSGTGTRFGVWAPGAERVVLELPGCDGSDRSVELAGGPDGSWWVQVDGVGAGQRYGYRVHGEWDPARGRRANPAQLLLDPWARAVTGALDLSGPVRDHVSGQTDQPDRRDSAGAVPWSVVVAGSAPPEPLAGRRREDPVVYETHLAGQTRTHPGVPGPLRGTYSGLAHPASVQHLLDLGVTTVELLPVQQFVSEPHLVARGLTNYWGYTTLAFLAPHAGYSSRGSLGGQVHEFTDMVTALHRAGLEVVLDIVLNHTCEGDQHGPTLSQRGLANDVWYRLDADGRQVDVTGCGNSVDTSSAGVLAFVLDCLRYWVTEMGVDGFRFDLASTLLRDREHRMDRDHPFLRAVASDPVLSGVRLIAEPWDLGSDGYRVGGFGAPWLEWNDRYRDLVRDFWRGRADGVAELATRLRGSPDLFDPDQRPSTASLNFVTAHDGFTLRDLVSYDHKHNEANGEDNRDGTDANRSTNHGVEGETDDPRVRAARRRHAAHLMATLLLSAGTPMVTAGDERGRTQHGNNNAYCQDTDLSWMDWSGTRSEPWSELQELTTTLLRLRREHPLLRPLRASHGEEVLDTGGAPTGRLDLAWLSGAADPAARGGAAVMDQPGWQDRHRRVLGMYLADVTESLLVWFHAGEGELDLTLPGAPLGTGWELLLDTSGQATPDGDRLRLVGPAVVLLRSPG